MKNKKLRKSIVKHYILAQLLLGIVIMAIAAFLAVQADMAGTQRLLSTTTGYIKEQCNRYARIELAAETKSLMRIIESGKQIAHRIQEPNSRITEEVLREYARDSYVSGVILLDAEGKVLVQYHNEGNMPAKVMEALDSPALLDTVKYPEKRYAVRLYCADGSEIDLAAVSRTAQNGILVAYYHTPLEYIESFNLSVASLLSGYSMENDGTIVVSNGEKIVASNDAALMGQSTSDIPILHKIKLSAAGSKMTHTSIKDGSISQYFGLMECGHDFYVYSFLPERSVFPNTPRTLLYTLIAYIVILMGISIVRWKTTQRAQKEFSERLQSKNEQLSVAVREADRANAAKTGFLSRMSHDIRTPLNGIIGLLEIDAAHPEDTELVNSNREKMRIAAGHLLALINDVLQMSKLESGEITLAHEPMDLKALRHEIRVVVEQSAAEAGVTLLQESGFDKLEPNWVYGSPLHIRQIFLNIFSNCVKYNKVGGSISTKVNKVREDEKTVVYRWTIRDTGIGMSKEYLHHIFDPFTQENTDARSVYQGTGLGMAIVNGLVEQMHGSIEVSSELGIGSTFVITIPFEIAEAKKTEATDENTAERADIRGLHLMLVEDNDLNAEIAQMLLEDAGAIVTNADNGQKAVDLFRENPAGTFDVILMDMMMPVMDGITATKAIRALDRPDAKTVPVIAMTANAFAEDAEKCLAAGMNAHLAKPLDINKVIATIAQYRA